MNKLIVQKIKNLLDTILCFFIFFDKNILSLNKISSMMSPPCLSLLYLIAKKCNANGDILEIGSFKGGSAFALLTGNKLSERRSKVWLIEPNPQLNKEEFLYNLKHYFGKDVELIDETSEKARKIINLKFRFVFIDGDHRYEFVKKDILLWRDLLQNGGVIAFHDYNLPGVSRAIRELIIDSTEFIILGKLAGIFYASKGKFENAKLISDLNKFEKIRKRFANIVNKLVI